MANIVIIDYNMGNLHSVTKALEHVSPDDEVLLSSKAEDIAVADRVVFPGQGAARDCMQAIDDFGLRESILEAAKTKPFLGICMGMQVLMQFSEENQGTELLGKYKGRISYFGDDHQDPKGNRLKVPQMGWNRVMQSRAHPLWQGIEDGSRFYFVHSYYLHDEPEGLAVGRTDYGFRYSCAIAQDNVFALQCHPEKSSHAGLKLLENFTRWDGQA